ncbi:hypothetical protein Pth03_51900 [Planotetraspora thailandica]|uniref:histidine kinase n=1 Tax=Planotetraspora thailandica TaxID=487172 RepID=A0A8J3V4P1_9ACTN|nr:HAMP domain-containing sensor histidine kinase [Planotetraspora thailandica]GII56801.1 hypothetical protein Pth03_51900 [Planotetraspora thailandica]
MLRVAVRRRGQRCPLSLRLRYTLIATLSSFLVLTGTGAALDLAVRHRPPTPPLFADYSLEFWIAVGALVILSAVTWLTWKIVDRSLCAMKQIRARLCAITPDDLSLRLPQPPGQDEIALLVMSANDALDRMEGIVEQHRRFTSDASHELRLPMAGMRLRLEDALADPDEGNAYEAIRAALTSMDRLQAIIDDLLVLARISAEKSPVTEVVDLDALIAESAAGRTGRVPVSVHVTGGAQVHGSPVQFYRIMENLLNNAQRHARSRVDITVDAEDEQVVVTVSDDGDGIDPKDHERVFERFTRLDSGRSLDPGGSGLGLAISREIAEAHGGTLRCEDAQEGARLVLRLRRLVGEPADPVVAA